MERYRNFFRIEYPFEIRPIFSCQGENHEVFNVSEQGIKFAITTKNSSLKVGNQIKGTVKFINPEDALNVCEVSGMILRKDSGECAIQLKDGIPWKKILTEQRYLIKRYGTFKQPDPIP